MGHFVMAMKEPCSTKAKETDGLSQNVRAISTMVGSVDYKAGGFVAWVQIVLGGQ